MIVSEDTVGDLVVAGRVGDFHYYSVSRHNRSLTGRWEVIKVLKHNHNIDTVSVDTVGSLGSSWEVFQVL